MLVYDIIAVAIGLGMDAMSVCMGIGVRWHGPRQQFRMAWHMGLFQFLMPIIGWSFGRELADLLKNVGTYIAAALVFLVGLKMLYEALKHHAAVAAAEQDPAVDAPPVRKDPTKGFSLVVLSIATSLDALVVGFSLGIKEGKTDILIPSVVIGLVAAAMAWTGLILGKHIGERLGKPAEIVGAIFLMALAASFLLMK